MQTTEYKGRIYFKCDKCGKVYSCKRTDPKRQDYYFRCYCAECRKNMTTT